MKTEKNILIAFILNLVFSIFEFIGGIFTGSISILSDSIHDLGDSISIGLSYFLEKKSKKGPDTKYTYGYIRFSVLGGLIMTCILLISSSFIIYEAIKRLLNPIDINYNGMIIFAVFGFIVNLIASLVTRDGDSINQKAVNLHMLEDVLGWLIVLIGAIVIKLTNINRIDSILSILVAAFIFINAIRNLKTITDLFLEKTPSNIDISKIKKDLLKIKGVEDIHHIHIRSIDGYNNYISMDIAVKEYDYKIKNKVKEKLQDYNISHSTLELELLDEDCDKECRVDEKHTHHHH